MFFLFTYLSVDRPLTPSRVIKVITLSLLSRISKLLPKISGGRSHFSLKFWASLNPASKSLVIFCACTTRARSVSDLVENPKTDFLVMRLIFNGDTICRVEFAICLDAGKQ